MVRYPTENSCLVGWHGWLLRGFREIGERVELSEELGAWTARKAKNEHRFVIPMDVHGVRVWYDFFENEPARHFAQIAAPSDVYMKIQVAPGMPKRIRVIGQCAAHPEYEDVIAGLDGAQHHDVTFIGRVTNFSLRVKAVEMLRGMTGVKAQAWLEPYRRNRAAPPGHLAGPHLSYEEHLAVQKQSRVCLALPGVGAPWTWRHTEILGLGRCMVMPRTDYARPGNSSGAWAECEPDLSDLPEVVEHLLGNDGEREQIAANGRRYYEKHLSPAAQARYVRRLACQSGH